MMIIPEAPHKGLLNDDEATAFVSEKLKPWTNLLRDLANYGSNLIPRAYSSSGKTLGDAIVIGVLLRQVVAMADAIEILLCRSAVHAAELQLRAMFEAAVYIDWMLAGDREKKASYYYVYNLLQLRKWARRVQPGTAESISFKSSLGDLPVDETLGDEGRRQVADIDRVLSGPEFVAIRDELKSWRRKSGRSPNWYSPLGISDLRRMAITVNKEAWYVMLYGSGSHVMHASKYGHHIHFGPGRISFRSIRHPQYFSHLVRLTAVVALDVYMKILQEYRRGERETQFSRKYREKWRSAFMNIPKINIQTQDITF